MDRELPESQHWRWGYGTRMGKGIERREGCWEKGDGECVKEGEIGEGEYIGVRVGGMWGDIGSETRQGEFLQLRSWTIWRRSLGHKDGWGWFAVPWG